MFLAWINVQGTACRASVFINEVRPVAIGDVNRSAYLFSDGSIRTAYPFERQFETRSEAVEFCAGQIRDAARHLAEQADELAAQETQQCAPTT